MALQPSRIVEHFEEIQVQRPSDLILEQIRELIRTNVLKPGQRLPAERVLCDRFGVGRGHVREALRKLEFYGLVKTRPQSGTVVEPIGVGALDGLISNVIGISGPTDYKTLYEVRDVLEMQSARLAAQRATQEAIEAIDDVLEANCRDVESGGSGLGEDAVFHVKIAEASGNVLLRTLISLLAPQMIKVSQDFDTCRFGRAENALAEHRQILDAIRDRDPERAAREMVAHITESRRQHQRIVEGLNDDATDTIPENA